MVTIGAIPSFPRAACMGCKWGEPMTGQNKQGSKKDSCLIPVFFKYKPTCTCTYVHLLCVFVFSKSTNDPLIPLTIDAAPCRAAAWTTSAVICDWCRRNASKCCVSVMPFDNKQGAKQTFAWTCVTVVARKFWINLTCSHRKYKAW